MVDTRLVKASFSCVSMVGALTSMDTQEKEAFISLVSTISGHTDIIPEKLIQRYKLKVQRHIDTLISELYPTVDRVTEAMTEEWDSFNEDRYSRVLQMEGEVTTLWKAALDLLDALQTSAPASAAASLRTGSSSPASPPAVASTPSSPPSGTSPASSPPTVASPT